MSQAHDDYIAKKTTYDAATQSVTKIISRLQSFAGALSNWQKSHIDIFGEATPSDMASARSTKIDGNGIPTPAELQKALVAQYKAQREGHQAWTSIPDAERQELKPPPWLIRR
jgi:hypothetical protein